MYSRLVICMLGRQLRDRWFKFRLGRHFSWDFSCTWAL